MPYPDKPQIQTSYTAEEQSLGNGSLPGQELDIDLANLKASIEATIDFLKASLRSDGKLVNGSVTSDSLSASLRLGFNPPAQWMTATDYTVVDTVFEGFGFYLCSIPHTSGTFATDLSAGRWLLLADLTPPGGALIADQNLTDLTDASAARAALGLGTMATATAGTGATQYQTNEQNDADFQPLSATLTTLSSATAAGLALMDDANAAAQRATLGVDVAGAGVLQQGGSVKVAAEATGAAVTGLLKTTTLKVRGLIDLASVDINTVTDGGFYYLQTSVTNGPDNSQAWFMLIPELSSNDVQQWAFRHAVNCGQIAIRQRLAGVWTAWRFIGARDASASRVIPAAAFDDFTDVPIYATEVNIYIDGASPVVAGAVLGIRLRAVSAGVITTGYYGSTSTITASAATAGFSATDQAQIAGLVLAADSFVGDIKLRKVGASNVWTIAVLGRRNDAKFDGFWRVNLGANPINGFRLLLDTGNFDGGAYVVDWRT